MVYVTVNAVGGTAEASETRSGLTQGQELISALLNVALDWEIRLQFISVPPYNRGASR
jgi:hypothetical protein